ncbi:MAG: hypothetical protein QW688_07540 [Thermoprotei archaeon]
MIKFRARVSEFGKDKYVIFIPKAVSPIVAPLVKKHVLITIERLDNDV